ALVQTSTSSQLNFFYDVTAPTVTLQVPALSTTSANPTWLKALPTLSGTIIDNINDPLNTLTVYVQIIQDGAQTLRPNFGSFGTNAQQFEVSVSTDWLAWSQSGLQNWSLDLSQVVWHVGSSYTLKIYTQDGAGNATGSSGSPA